MLLFGVAENKNTPEWLELQRQAASVASGTVVSLLGQHYLHHAREGSRGWVQGAGRR
ncbi:hypothetical protein [Paenarthrobacter sp. TA1.8]|uniref:hypothetical protein n=1 Tax=Paenarthrobacter sp. TA1.8 TaxID=3400219 RepID=UPI003B429549